MFRRLARLFGYRSPSESARWTQFGTAMAEGMKRGIEQSDAHRAELIASGLTPEEAQLALMRELILDDSPEMLAMLAHAEGVARRSFPALYEDDEEG